MADPDPPGPHLWQKKLTRPPEKPRDEDREPKPNGYRLTRLEREMLLWLCGLLLLSASGLGAWAYLWLTRTVILPP